MKKYFVLMAVTMLSGCSYWNNLSWDMLNPWSENDVSVESAETQPALPANVNKYLWQAGLDKISFMEIVSENPQEGRIETAWKNLPSAPNERFKIVAEINDGELRADALHVKVYKEVKGKNGWTKTAPSSDFEKEIEQAIISRAKVLYIQDQDKE